MSSASTKNHQRDRLLKVAIEECHRILKPVKAAYPALTKLTVSFEDTPSPALLQRGVRRDCDSYFDLDEREIVIFLFNIYEKTHAAEEFRRRVREAVYITVEDLAGTASGADTSCEG